MRVLFTAQIREADQYTIAHEPIASVDLMERAGYALFEKIIRYKKNRSYIIFCGIGNNGGDGLVIARLLSHAGLKVRIVVVEFSKKYSEDFKINLERTNDLNIQTIFIRDENFDIELYEDDIVVDAIFGSGLSKPVRGFAEKVVKFINSSSHQVVSIDSPSGMYNENPVPSDCSVVKADITYTIGLPKLALFIPENEIFIGKWELVKIGLKQDFILSQRTGFNTLEQEDIEKMIRVRSAYGHKGTYGHALIVAGNPGKVGAGILSANSCIKTGAGLVTALLHGGAVDIMHMVAPEIMCISTDEEYVDRLKAFDVIGAGPGLGTGKYGTGILKKIIRENKKPMVLDADAINILSINPELIRGLPKKTILTPHFKEFERLVGPSQNHYERLKKLQTFADQNKLIVVLKGRHTAIGIPEKGIFFNTTGNPGMATAGSGDVLTGMITALLSQGYNPEESAKIGVYIHGLAGDQALKTNSQESLTSSDIIRNIGYAFKQIHEVCN